MGLSSILTSSSSLGGVTGRGKLPKSGFWASVVLELVPNAKIPGFNAPCTDSSSCGAAGFSGEAEGAPNLNAKENAGLDSFDDSLCTTTGGLADSSGDGIGVDCCAANSFELSVELVVPNPRNGAPAGSPNEKTVDVGSFRSGAAAAVLSSIAEVAGGPDAVEMSVDSAAGFWDGRSPNRFDDVRSLGGIGAGNGAFSGPPPNGVGVGSTFAGDVGKVGVWSEVIVGAAATGGTGTDWVVPDGPEVSVDPFAPMGRGVGSKITEGVG